MSPSDWLEHRFDVISRFESFVKENEVRNSGGLELTPRIVVQYYLGRYNDPLPEETLALLKDVYELLDTLPRNDPFFEQTGF